MDPVHNAEELVRAGDPARALTVLQDQVRAAPGDGKLRVFLFQLLCVLGQWERALAQLDVVAKLDVSALPMAQTYREAIRCELLRDEVFGGRKTPMVFGQPDAWLALLIEALLRSGRGDAAEGLRLRETAFEQAPATTGSLRTGSHGPDDPGIRFEWIADADTRLGPVLEAIVNGRYYWVPFARLSLVKIDAPADLRDSVWMPAHLRFENGGESVALDSRALPWVGIQRRPSGGAFAQDDLAGTRATGVRRSRPARARNRRGRVPLDGSAVDRSGIVGDGGGRFCRVMTPWSTSFPRSDCNQPCSIG